jgi:phospholipid/cholesterol/gamma-HCH transport system ATP-binding protein
MENSDTAPALEFREVSLSYGDTVAVDRVSFVLPRGAMYFVTGASGSGKSTLLKLALGLVQPDSGEVLIDGQPIAHLSEDQLLEIRLRKLGMAFQDQASFSGLSVFDNVAYRLIEQGRPQDEIERNVDEMLRWVGLYDDRDKLPGELSGGMERRLELARAVAGWPPIMLFDEPTSSLDPVNAESILKLIMYGRDQLGVSSLYVTKELDEIPYLAGRTAELGANGRFLDQPASPDARPETKVLLMEDGAIVFTGSADEFAASAKPAVTYLTHAENGTQVVEFYIPDPWSKRRRPREPIL